MGSSRTPADIAARLPPEQWSARLAEALERALALDCTGASRSAALRELFPDPYLPSLLRRLRIDELGGRDDLIHRHLPVKPVRTMDDEARGALRALPLTDPHAGSVMLAERLSATLGRSVRATAVQHALNAMGLGLTPRRQDAKAGRLTENEVAKVVVDAAFKVRTALGPGLRESHCKLGLRIPVGAPLIKDGIARVVNGLDRRPPTLCVFAPLREVLPGSRTA